jgi:hypothetical protein
MPSLQPYDDLPGIDEEGFAYNPLRTEMQQIAMNTYWATLDPTLQPNQYTPEYSNIQPARHLQDMLDHLGNFANGYGYPATLQIPNQAFSSLDIYTPWTEQYRNVRYVSPNGHPGSTLSSTGSSPSERAFSPDVSRYHAGPSVPSQIASNVFPFPAVELSYIGNNNNSWSQRSTFVGGLASPCPSSHASAACNLKDLQFVPDSSMEEDHFDSVDTIRVKMNIPEELVLSPEVGSPADSGIGPSVDDHDDVSIKDEDDDIAPESDNDTEYTPTHAGRKSSMNTRRPSMRSPHSQRSLHTSNSTSAVLDPKARVSKATNRKTSAATPSKKANAMKTDKADAKQFTCTFSHYGCDAKFASKNEWKRHVSSQHLQLGFYRCDVGACHPEHQNGASASQNTKRYNDFNRKDLFTQHHRRMHTPWGNPKEGTKKQWEEFEESLEDVRSRCWRVRRNPPQRSGCGFCGRIFEDRDSDSDVGKKGENRDKDRGNNSWELRMEHVGKHFERQDWDVEVEREDEDLTAWALAEGIVRDFGARGVWLVGLGPPEVNQKSRGGRRRSGRKSTTDEVVNDDESEPEPEHDEDEDALGEDE